MNEWLAKLAAELDLDAELGEEDADALLKIARIAAHTSDDRRNAPLLAYLRAVAGRRAQRRCCDRV